MNNAASSEEKREWIERTLLNLREGHGSIAEVTALRTLLMEDREARLIYLRSNQLDCMLGTVCDETEVTPPARAGGLRIRRGHLVSAVIGGGIAAAVILMATLGPFERPARNSDGQGSVPKDQPVASLLSDYEAVIGGDAATGASSFGEGELLLDRGIAQLAFRNGAQIVLEGKCGFEILNETTVVLTHGKMWAYCPEEARGFKVLTPGGREIIDLGTEFGVEVSPTGETDVHVYDGLVDVVDPGSRRQRQRIEAGEALRWFGNSKPANVARADFDKFVTANMLAQRRLKAHRGRMLARTDLLLYYDFSDQGGHRAGNKATVATKSSSGRIFGAASVAGRTGGMGALQFEHPDDGVAFRLERPQEIRKFTIALWVKVDRLETPLSALLNSDGWDPGDTHFQITREGKLRAGIYGGGAFQSRSDCVQPGRWQLLAVTWDLDAMTAHFSCDGKRLQVKPHPNGLPPIADLDPQFGACRVGSWGGRPPASLRDVRDLRGRIDEVMIFDHALSDEEFAALYAAGSP